MAKKTTAKKSPTKKAAAKNLLTNNSLAFLERYLNNASPTGFESGGQKIWLDYLKPYVDDHFVDTYGTAVGVINPSAKYKVVIEAHADEISWFVHYITKEGFIYVRRNGGSDHIIAPSKRVNIHTDKGIVKAVFGWPAIHVRNGKTEITPILGQHLPGLRLQQQGGSGEARRARGLRDHLRGRVHGAERDAISWAVPWTTAWAVS